MQSPALYPSSSIIDPSATPILPLFLDKNINKELILQKIKESKLPLAGKEGVEKEIIIFFYYSEVLRY